MKHKKIIIFSILLLVLSMITIFLFSSESGISSNETSKTVAKEVLKVVKKDKEVTEQEVNDFYKSNIVIIRKVAHLTEFAILGFLMINTYQLIKKELNKKAIAISTFLSFIYACTDELHQYFVNGRTARILDIFVDTTGALLGCLLFYLIYKKITKKQTD